MAAHVLGNGNFATVNLCTEKSTKEQYAVKCIDKSKLNESRKYTFASTSTSTSTSRRNDVKSEWAEWTPP